MIGITDITDAVLCDAKDMAEIEKLCFAQPWSEGSIRDFLDNEFSVCFVAKSENKTIGYIGMYITCGDGDITNVAVHPSFRRRGVAQALLKNLIGYSVSHGISKLMLEVRSSNLPARTLYEKFGFVPVGIRKNYYTQPKEDAVLMDLDVRIAKEN